MSERIAVVGLGYVGLPVALAFARKFEDTVGFDISAARVSALKRNEDWTGEVSEMELASSRLQLSSDPADLRGCTFFVVAVPTPIDSDRRPDLGPLFSASRIVGSALAPGALVVYEAIIDDDRSQNAFGLLMSLNMLVETEGGFDYTGKDCTGWMKEAGFSTTRVEHLVGPDSMVIAIKATAAFAAP